jgi:hypothetical protein
MQESLPSAAISLVDISASMIDNASVPKPADQQAIINSA